MVLVGAALRSPVTLVEAARKSGVVDSDMQVLSRATVSCAVRKFLRLAKFKTIDSEAREFVGLCAP